MAVVVAVAVEGEAEVEEEEVSEDPEGCEFYLLTLSEGNCR